jgi:hypothetical protein
VAFCIRKEICEKTALMYKSELVRLTESHLNDLQGFCKLENDWSKLEIRVKLAGLINAYCSSVILLLSDFLFCEVPVLLLIDRFKKFKCLFGYREFETIGEVNIKNILDMFCFDKDNTKLQSRLALLWDLKRFCCVCVSTYSKSKFGVLNFHHLKHDFYSIYVDMMDIKFNRIVKEDDEVDKVLMNLEYQRLKTNLFEIGIVVNGKEFDLETDLIVRKYFLRRAVGGDDNRLFLREVLRDILNPLDISINVENTVVMVSKCSSVFDVLNVVCYYVSGQEWDFTKGRLVYRYLKNHHFRVVMRTVFDALKRNRCRVVSLLERVGLSVEGLAELVILFLEGIVFRKSDLARDEANDVFKSVGDFDVYLSKLFFSNMNERWSKKGGWTEAEQEKLFQVVLSSQNHLGRLSSASDPELLLYFLPYKSTLLKFLHEQDEEIPRVLRNASRGIL